MSKFSFVLLGIAFLYTCSSCGNRTIKEQQYSQLVREWMGKEIIFPSENKFSIIGNGNENESKLQSCDSPYKIVSYVDPKGCISCHLRLPAWKIFMDDLHNTFPFQVSVMLFFYPEQGKMDEIQFILKRDNFDYPVCIDVNDSLNKLNHFPSNMAFQTFLLDKDNKVLAIGNPVLNPAVKELYLKIIQGKPLQDDSKDKQVMTTVSLEATVFSMGDFAWQEERQGTFRLKNTGEKPLVIQDIVTSCGCLTVDYSQEPVQPGKEAVLRMTYKADNPGYFNKAATVYCNAENSPIRLRVSGNALEKG